MVGTALLATAASALVLAMPATPAARHAFQSDQARGVLSRRYLAVTVTESIAVPPAQVAALLGAPDVLGRLLVAYARRLPNPEQVAGSLRRDGEGAYHYAADEGEPTQVQELYCGAGEAGALEAIYFARGRRFFGAYSSLIRVVVEPEGARSRFSLWLYVYPENALLRFAARNLGLLERYFRARTHELCLVAEEVIPEAAGTATAEVSGAMPAHAARDEITSGESGQQ